MRNNKNKGFTLVELLVVIAILAILATVSVVGYTSFIKSAEISNDQNLASQLNNFLVALKADSNGDFYNADVTPENVWAVTDEIRNLGGLDEITPTALKYGHLYFRFDKDEDGNYVGGEYVFVEDKDIKNSGLHFVLRAFGLLPNERPGFFEGNDDNLYFLIDTAGSNLAEAVRGFYTFDFLAEEEDAWAKFKEIVADAAAEGHTNIFTALENTVFVTAEGSKWVDGKESYDLIFHVDKNVTLSEGTPAINVEVDANGVATPVVIPENVVQVEVESLTLNYSTGTTPTNAPVVFEAPAEELGDVIDAEFPYNFVDGNGATCVVENAHIETSTGESIKIVISNYLTDFDMVISGTTNKYYTSVAEDEFSYEGENKTGITTNKLNSAYIVWDGGSFTLELDETDYEFYFSNPERSSLSSKKINWEIAGYTAIGDVTLTDADKACVSLSGNTITLNKLANGNYPQIASITVKGTVAHVADDVTPATRTFTIILPRINAATFTFGGKDVIDNTVDVIWGEKGDGTLYNTYEVALKSATGNDGLNKGLTYDSTITVSSSWATDDTVQDGNEFTFNNVFGELNDSTKSKAITMTVNVGGYETFTFTANLNHAKFLFEVANSTLKYIGTEGVVNASDFFKQVGEETLSNVKINAYLKPTAGTTMTIENLNKGKLPVPKGTEGDTTHQMYGVWADVQSGAFDSTEFDLGLLTSSTTEATVVFVVTVDGVRASENYEVTVVDAQNVRADEDLSATGNNTLLNDINLDGAAGTDNDGKMTVAAGKTFYGNGFTITVTDGIRKYVENHGNGIVALHGTMRDTKVVGEIFSDWAARVSVECGASTVTSMNGNAKLINCYLANSKSPLRMDSNITVENCIFFGGRHANIDIAGAFTLTMHGTNITVNQNYQNQAGTGIAVWWTEGIKPVIKVEDYTKADGTVVVGDLIQYNFISSNDSMPKITTTSLGIDTDIVEVDLGIIFNSLINDSTYANQGLVFTDSSTGTKYVNAGIVYLNKSSDEAIAPTGLSGYFMTNYELTAAKAFPNTEVCFTWPYTQKHYTGCTHRIAFTTAMEVAIRKSTMNVMVYTMKSAEEPGITTFANQAGAVAKYKPEIWDFDASGNIIHN